MILTDQQAQILILLLADTLTKDVVGYLSMSPGARAELLGTIVAQQSEEKIELKPQEQQR